MVRDIGKNYTYVLWFTSSGNGSKCLPANDCFSGCYFFYPTIFLTFWEIVFLPIHSYPQPPIQWLPLVRWWHWVAEIYSSSSSLAFALILLNFLPLTNLELTSPYTHIWIFIYLDYSIFPLLILRSKCTWVHDIGDMGQTLSSWSLKNSWVLCRISRISVILVISFTLISEFSSY